MGCGGGVCVCVCVCVCACACACVRVRVRAGVRACLSTAGRLAGVVGDPFQPAACDAPPSSTSYGLPLLPPQLDPAGSFPSTPGPGPGALIPWN